jgi:hypothetical protein
MNDLFAGQSVGIRDLGLSCLGPTETSAFLQQARPSSSVYSAVNSAAAQKTLVGSVHDSSIWQAQGCYVVADQADFLVERLRGGVERLCDIWELP